MEKQYPRNNGLKYIGEAKGFAEFFFFLLFWNACGCPLARLRVLLPFRFHVITFMLVLSDRPSRGAGSPWSGPADRLPPAGDGGFACPRGDAEGVRNTGSNTYIYTIRAVITTWVFSSCQLLARSHLARTKNIKNSWKQKYVASIGQVTGQVLVPPSSPVEATEEENKKTTRTNEKQKTKEPVFGHVWNCRRLCPLVGMEVKKLEHPSFQARQAGFEPLLLFLPPILKIVEAPRRDNYKLKPHAFRAD